MRRKVFSLVGIATAGLCTVALLGQQPQPPAVSGAYTTQCSACHGAEMTGGTGPGILAYIRYHTDAEARAQILQKHPSLQLSDDVLRQVMADTRILAGTNPAMATSGFTGRREARGRGTGFAGAGRPGGGGTRGQAPAVAPAGVLTPLHPSTMQPDTIKMAGGTT